MLRSYLPKRILLVGVAAACCVLATPMVLRRWLIDRGEATFNTTVAIGSVKVYPRSSTLHLSDVAIGNERGPATFSIGQSWLTWKNDSWSDGPLRFRRAILDEVRIEATPPSHDYFGVLEQLQLKRPQELIPAIYREELVAANSPTVNEFGKSILDTANQFRNVWQQEKTRLVEASRALTAALQRLEETEKLNPNSLRDRENLEATMQQALQARQQLLQSRQRLLTFVETVAHAEKEFETKRQEGLDRVTAALHLDEMIYRDMSASLLKQHGLSQTAVWLDYIATGRSLLGGLQLPELVSRTGKDFHFADTAPQAKSCIDELTLQGELALHHRIHKIFLRGVNLRSLPQNQLVTQVSSDTEHKAELKPTILRGEVVSRGDTLLFDFRRLWESEVQTHPQLPRKLPEITAHASDVITLESQSIGPSLGEMEISSNVRLAWEGRRPWIWTQWRFDNNNRWRAKWIIRQENIRLFGQDITSDGSRVQVAESLTNYIKPLNRIDVELDVVCVDNQYTVTTHSNLATWLPNIVRTVYEAEEASQLERIRTAIQTRTDQELGSLQSDVQKEQTELLREINGNIAKLEKLSTDLASKLGVSPRVLLTQEPNEGVTR
jgi:hypothetical protein